MSRELQEMLVLDSAPRQRDSKRQRVYDSEWVLPRGRLFSTVPEMQEYVSRLLETRWFRRHFPGVLDVEVRDGRGRRSASCWGSTHAVIAMPRWARDERTLLHEVAHACTISKYGQKVAAHGREFCRTFVALVQNRLGKKAADDLRMEYRRRGVKYSLPRRLTSEQRQRLRERGRQLAAARTRP